MALPKLIPLPDAPRRLAALTGGPTRSYARVWRGVVNAEFPAIRDNGRYFIDEKNLPEVAAALGLTVAPVAA